MITPELISQIGFPMAVTIYLLYERAKFSADITVKLEQIAILLDKLEDKMLWSDRNG